MAIEDHTFGEGYSEHHKIPTVSDFRETQRKRYEDADERARKLSMQATEDYVDTDAYRKERANSLGAQDGGAAGGNAQGAGRGDAAQHQRDQADVPADQDDDQTEGDLSKIPRENGPKTGKEEKEEAMAKATAGQDKANKVEYKGERVVTDPVTGKDVIVKDAQENAYDIERLDPKQTSKTGPSLAPPPTNKHAYDTIHTSPKPASPTNLLLQPFPSSVDDTTKATIHQALNTMAGGVGALSAIIWFLTAFRAGFWAFVIRTTLCAILGVGTFFACGILGNKLEQSLEAARADMHRKRGLNHSPPVPESTEWLNAIIATVWPLIDPSLFAGVVDMVEDIMQASLPKFVEAVRISDLGLGSNPFRIVAIRGLPDQQSDKEYPREEWIYRSTPKESQLPFDDAAPNSRKDRDGKPQNKQAGDSNNSNVAQTKVEKERQDKKEKSAQAKADQPEQSMNDVDKTEEELDQAGDYVNYEVSIVYQAKPGKTVGDRASNVHLLIQFFLGAYDWFHIPIPIWIQFEGLVVTARLRLQMVPQPPYVRNLTFTLMGVPKVQLSAIPMSKFLPNVLDLPLISGFVQSSVAAAANEYVAPKSMTLNLASILTGDGIKKDTLALGIFVITLHHAEDLSAQDSNGKSDPYIVVSYAKFGKPLYSTRIISGDLNPVFEETAVLLVSADEVKSGESLSLQLWDNDKMSADDLVGRVNVNLEELMVAPGKTFRRTDKLLGFEDADSMSGNLTWSVAYYEKAKLDRSLMTKKGTAEGEPDEVANKPGAQQQPTPADNKEEADALFTPPRKDLKSGILSVIVHQVSQLERQNLKGASGKKAKEGQEGQDTDAPEEEGHNLPNSYCEIMLNDNMIYKTRTKMYTSMPFFEAGTEVFVRDWTTAVVRVAVRDARLREHDPLLGIVTLKLTDVLAGSSQNTLTTSIQEGVGFGRANISILFKAVEAKLPKNMLGWETSTVEFLSDITLDTAGMDSDFSTKKLTLHTNDGEQKISSKLAHIESNKVTWDIGDEDIRLPIYGRYNNAVHFELGSGSSLNPLDDTPDAIAVLWLRDLVDEEETQIRIPVIKGKDMKLLRQNYHDEQMRNTHPYETVGYLTCTIRLDPGLDPDHEQIAMKTNNNRHGFEVYDHVEGQAKVAEENAHANDDGVIDKKEQKQIAKSHKKALESRHRGKMQLSAVRTVVWMKDGLKARKNALKSKLPGQEDPKDRKIESEV